MQKTELVLKKLKPMFTRMLTTANEYTETDAITSAGIIDSRKLGQIKEIQTIVSVNPNNHLGLKDGDLVMLNYNRYEVRKHVQDKNSIKEDIKDEIYKPERSYELPMITVNNEELLNIDTGDVLFVIEDYEYVTTEINTSGLYLPNNKLIGID